MQIQDSCMPAYMWAYIDMYSSVGRFVQLTSMKTVYSLQRTVTEWKNQYGDGFVIASRCDVTKGKELEGDDLRKGLLVFHIN